MEGLDSGGAAWTSAGFKAIFGGHGRRNSIGKVENFPLGAVVESGGRGADRVSVGKGFLIRFFPLSKDSLEGRASCTFSGLV